MKKSILTPIIALTSMLIVNGKSNFPSTINQPKSCFFIENKGQWHQDVLYLYRIGNLDAWITRYGVNFIFYKMDYEPTGLSSKIYRDAPFEIPNYDKKIGHQVILKWKNASSNVESAAIKPLKGYYNYFIGNDPSQYATQVKLYQEVIVRNVYSGVDVRYYIDRGFLRFDFIVHPGGNPNQIEFELEGAFNSYLKDQQLCFTTRFGEVALTELNILQDDKQVGGKFSRAQNSWKILVSKYDRSKTLIIDPLVYSTYVGRSASDAARGIVIDSDNNAYITGVTVSMDYFLSPGAFQSTYGGGTSDIFVTKLNAAGSDFIYSTYIGGSSGDAGESITIDSNNCVYVGGWTQSSNYPTTTGAFQTTYGGVRDAIVTKLNADGTALLYSTFIGGTNYEYGNGITVDTSGHAYVIGWTASLNYPTTPGVFQTVHEGGTSDIFVSKLNPSGSDLIYSTYIGGSGSDLGYNIVVDTTGNAYVCGASNSANFDTTPGAFKTSNSGNFDGFVAKLNSNASNLIYSTFIGGTAVDRVWSVAIDASGHAYATGITESANFDTTLGAFQTSHAGDNDAFVVKLNPSGSGLIYSTFLGGSGYELAWSIAVDASGSANITGQTNSANFPTTSGAHQTSFGGGTNDVFVTKLNPSGNSLMYSTYLGGTGNDIGRSITLKGSGFVFVTGFTASSDFDITTGAFQTTLSGSNDIFVTQVDVSSSLGIVDLEALKPKQWSVYPNPSQGEFNIKTEREAMFQLFDANGRFIRAFTLSAGEHQLNEKLGSGVYFLLELQSKTTEKLIVR